MVRYLESVFECRPVRVGRHSNGSIIGQMTGNTTIRFSWHALLCAVITLMASFAVTLHSSAQELARRLILKDGSYQLVTKYEVKGDRVRYMSAERNEWEELPSAIVDWPATEKYEKERATSAIPEASAIDKETEADREAELSHLPQVAPGLRLPDDSGVFLLDNFHGQPELVEMQQAEGEINQNTRANILRGALGPVASAKQTVELDGEHATLHAHVAVPSIYINIDEKDQSMQGPPAGETDSARPSQPSLDAPRAEPQGPQQPQQPEQAIVPFDRFRLVHVKAKGGKRVLGNMKRAVNGKVSHDENFVKTTIDHVSGGWLKLTPVEDLAPGEYAVVETKGAEGMNLYVWDFGVNPNAAENPHPWKPEPSTPSNPPNSH